MKKVLWLALFSCLIAGIWYFSSRTPEPQTSVQGVNQSTIQATNTDNIVLKRVSSVEFSLKTAEPEAVILDLRTAEEFATGHLAKAREIDFYATDFANQLQKLDKNTTYLIYCRSGNRSSKTLETMRSLGFKSVFELDGGINSWNLGNRPVCTNC